MPTAAPPDGLAILKTLTPKQQRFCREYVIDFNAKQAALRSGYSSNGATCQATRLLANASIGVAVQALATRQANKLNLSAERVMTEVARIGFFDPRKLFHSDGKIKKPHEWDEDTAAAVSMYNWRKQEISFHPKAPMLSLAARITKIVDGEALPVHMQGNFMVICPADASPEQWKTMAVSQAAAAKKTPQLIQSNGHPHANGDGE